jgi:hypothetical protein
MKKLYILIIILLGLLLVIALVIGIKWRNNYLWKKSYNAGEKDYNDCVKMGGKTGLQNTVPYCKENGAFHYRPAPKGAIY